MEIFYSKVTSIPIDNILRDVDDRIDGNLRKSFDEFADLDSEYNPIFESVDDSIKPFLGSEGQLFCSLKILYQESMNGKESYYVLRSANQAEEIQFQEEITRKYFELTGNSVSPEQVSVNGLLKFLITRQDNTITYDFGQIFYGSKKVIGIKGITDYYIGEEYLIFPADDKGVIESFFFINDKLIFGDELKPEGLNIIRMSIVNYDRPYLVAYVALDNPFFNCVIIRDEDGGIQSYLTNTSHPYVIKLDDQWYNLAFSDQLSKGYDRLLESKFHNYRSIPGPEVDPVLIHLPTLTPCVIVNVGYEGALGPQDISTYAQHLYASYCREDNDLSYFNGREYVSGIPFGTPVPKIIKATVAESAAAAASATPKASVTPAATPKASVTPAATPKASVTPAAAPKASVTPAAPKASVTPAAPRSVPVRAIPSNYNEVTVVEDDYIPVNSNKKKNNRRGKRRS